MTTVTRDTGLWEEFARIWPVGETVDELVAWQEGSVVNGRDGSAQQSVVYVVSGRVHNDFFRVVVVGNGGLAGRIGHGLVTGNLDQLSPSLHITLDLVETGPLASHPAKLPATPYTPYIKF